MIEPTLYDVWLNEFSKNTFLGKYSMNGQETWAECCRRVVDAVCGRLLPAEEVEIIYQLMVERKFIPAGRYLYAAGRPFHQVNNCFLFRAEDSREGWSDLMHKSSMSLMTGGGIGSDYSKVRPKGYKIHKTGGEATGPIALMNMVNEAGRYIMQGGSRRSAIWAGLNWKHEDTLWDEEKKKKWPEDSDFLHLKNYSDDLKAAKKKDFNFPLPMEGTNISVIYDTEFFMAVEDKKHEHHKELSIVDY